MAGEFGRAFQGGYRVATDFVDRLEHNRKRPEREAREQEDRNWELQQRGMQQDRHAMAVNTHQMQMGRYEAFRREMNREASNAMREQTLARLVIERGILEGVDEGLDQQLAQQLWLDLFNGQERDLIDSAGDGRYLADVVPLPNGELAFQVEGGGVEGRQPITRNRGTAADGDNALMTMPIEEVMDYHAGQTEAFLRKFPDARPLLEDPKQRSAYLKALNGILSGKGGKSSAIDLETLRQANREKNAKVKLENAKELEDHKQGHRKDLKATPTAKTAAPPRDMSVDDKVNRLSKMMEAIREEDYEAGREMRAPEEYLEAARQRLGMLRQAVGAPVVPGAQAMQPAAPQPTPQAAPMMPAADAGPVDQDELAAALRLY